MRALALVVGCGRTEILYCRYVFGVLAIVVALVLFPVLILMSGGVASAMIGALLQRDGEVRHEGSELLELDD